MGNLVPARIDITLHIRDREPLRYASRLLGSTICSSLWVPGHGLVVGYSRGPRGLQNPISLSRRP
jgi:hypothetical protein